MGEEQAGATLPHDRGEVLLYEPGGNWWVVGIGPVLIAAVVAVEASGPGSIHWPVLSIFFVILTGFAILQVVAARRHVSVELTETSLRQGAQTIELSEIERVHPPNNSPDAKPWESAKALGELSSVPRRRKGVGLTLTSGKLTQAWARDHERLRTELEQAVLAVHMGLGPKGAVKPGTTKSGTTKSESSTTTERRNADEPNADGRNANERGADDSGENQ